MSARTRIIEKEADKPSGCGLNVSSPSPLTSLEQLIPPGMDKTGMSMEGTAATIMTVFDEMWDQFIQANGSFEPFMDLYLQRWLHSYVSGPLILLNADRCRQIKQRPTCEIDNCRPSGHGAHYRDHARPRPTSDYSRKKYLSLVSRRRVYRLTARWK